MYDTHHVQNLGTGFKFNERHFFSNSLVSLMFYQNWKLALVILMMPLLVVIKSCEKGLKSPKAGISFGNLSLQKFLASNDKTTRKKDENEKAKM